MLLMVHQLNVDAQQQQPQQEQKMKQSKEWKLVN